MTSPRIMMLSKPNFPTELVIEILTDLWLMPNLSNSERTHLLLTLPTVSRLFYRIFHTIAFRDVYITSPAYADHFLHLMQRREAFICNNVGDLVAPHELCHSLNFRIVNETGHPPISLPMTSIENFDWSRYTGGDTDDTAPSQKDKDGWDVLSDMLYRLSAIHSVQALPNLRRISISIIDHHFNDVFTNYIFSSFPTQVDTLELDFSFSRLVPPFLVGALKEKENEEPWARRSVRLPSVRKLGVRGTGFPFVKDMFKVCRNVRTIVTDVPLELIEGIKITF